ncbi:uncharacterized protein CYBJADRAFT_166327 [Cyberlindnera jadinii NRRL Y-1542]|uniref:Uncharacterized protein n=1 Tax=Cyberlindnera jadinii (strain ATCC 18201 / CBS 1600 / BCRC 20928 / JCM 3617 / NBRC 0987 / NRRL Y-1542) TaxID=983966 RepID=A0A1E4S7V6_CYBJN|nr:hypothetical protein CYBJADRAFT_166324 [Cyberlindnera jadinii NRRL Y-1542]XP_020072653.1 hypothetical protein CYBJADRAFT_166327 [Cyberlindnera jadinii NRRL Y-1542]ODV75613.1 hypothetical protein CYBJADRAFT_166324 [Cyberlindnera jadinii NRRL Y-1542]ODV75614.1 hypothetical protein CYBJADRAFT_166327 [Cyberlindnera jadinii NRRL Y-1542]
MIGRKILPSISSCSSEWGQHGNEWWAAVEFEIVPGDHLWESTTGHALSLSLIASNEP